MEQDEQHFTQSQIWLQPKGLDATEEKCKKVTHSERDFYQIR